MPHVMNRITVAVAIATVVTAGGQSWRGNGPSAASSPNTWQLAQSQAQSPTPPKLDIREAARRELDALYKGDYRRAFLEKRPELFLKHIAPNFFSTTVDVLSTTRRRCVKRFPGDSSTW